VGEVGGGRVGARSQFAARWTRHTQGLELAGNAGYAPSHLRSGIEISTMGGRGDRHLKLLIIVWFHVKGVELCQCTVKGGEGWWHDGTAVLQRLVSGHM
jgi:hypothetical protein